MREVNYYSRYCDMDERPISLIIDAFGGTTHSLLEITANKYGYYFVLNPVQGCLIDVYDFDPSCGRSREATDSNSLFFE